MDYPDHAEPIARVTRGMRVLDAAGDEIGAVDQVETGGPNRPGRITIDAKGLLSGALSASAAEIAAVHEDVVRLNVPRDTLVDRS